MAHISRTEKIDLMIIIIGALILLVAASTGVTMWAIWFIQALL